MQDWLTMRAADLGRGIDAGDIDPADLVETYLAAIAAHPFKDRIFTRVLTDRARLEAAAASERAQSGARKSLLDGVPVTWKDLFDTAGDPCESGTLMLKGRVAAKDARVVQNAAAAGMICLAKTHQTEFAFSGLGANPMTQSPPNVHDHAAVSGGSSSGAAASVAFGLAPVAIGSDTGGSVRIPSVWNDLVGLKTEWGRVSLEGVIPLCARFDTVGPLCRSVEDAALMLGVLENGDPRQAYASPLEGKRFGILTTMAFDGIEDAPHAAFKSAVERLRDRGVQFEEIDVPEVAEAGTLSPVLFPAEAYATWKDEIDAGEGKMYPLVRERFLSGKTVLASDFIAGWQRLDGLRKIYREKTKDFDAIVLPSAPIGPPKLDAVLYDDACLLYTSPSPRDS